MHTDNERFMYLLDRYLDKTASAEEFEEFFGLIRNEEYKELMLDVMKEEGKKLTAEADAHTIDWDNMYGEIVVASRPVRRKLFGMLPVSIAAAIVCLIGGAIYFVGKQEHPLQPLEEVLTHADVKPGGDKATLELADGTVIELNQSVSGVLAEQGSTKVNKQEEGVLVYQVPKNMEEEKVVYNTLRTPKGGKYMLVLPDNSKVWLNSGSSITFPNKFIGAQRGVKITGEVFFMVEKSAGQTFKVSTMKGEVEVLGTQFNVMSYQDEANEEVTLLEGSIRLKSGAANRMIRPGQLAVYNGNGDIDVKNLEFPEAKIDWKNGYFQFENESITQIMRKISRWYDVEVVYSGKVADKHFTGAIPRNNNVSKILNLLKKSGDLKFEINDKTIIVKE